MAFRAADRQRTGYIGKTSFAYLLAEYNVSLSRTELNFIAATMKTENQTSRMLRSTKSLSSLSSSLRKNGICYSEFLKTFLMSNGGDDLGASEEEIMSNIAAHPSVRKYLL